MPTLSELKGKNGLSIQSLADFLLEQSALAGCRGILIIVKPPETDAASPYAIVTNVKTASLPAALEGIAREMRIGLEEERVEEAS